MIRQSGHNYSQPFFRQDMDLWGETKGDTVHDRPVRKSLVLDRNGEPFELEPRMRIGFDLRPRNGGRND